MKRVTRVADDFRTKEMLAVVVVAVRVVEW